MFDEGGEGAFQQRLAGRFGIFLLPALDIHTVAFLHTVGMFMLARLAIRRPLRPSRLLEIRTEKERANEYRSGDRLP